MTSGINPKAALDILLSEHGDLYQLAEMSGIDPFRFYVGADLRNIDLANQDLRGLNFERADLRSANLSDIKFDVGAFNQSILSQEQIWFTDEYDLTYEDFATLTENLPFLYIFAEFRSSTLEQALAASKLPLWRIAKLLGINSQTLRKARNSHTVSRETARIITSFIQQTSIKDDELFERRRDRASNQQPAMRLLDVQPSGGFVQITKRELEKRFSLSEHFFDVFTRGSRS